MPEPIRVRDDKTLAEYSTYGIDENGEPYEGLTKLDEPAVDDRGELLPPKYLAAEPSTDSELEATTGGSPDTTPPAKKTAAPPRTAGSDTTKEN